MTTDEKLAAILAAVQTDPGNRGLARDPHDNLFTATKGDFEAACGSIANYRDMYAPTDWQDPPRVAVLTGFWICNAEVPAYETDGPLGAVFLASAFNELEHCQPLRIFAEEVCLRSITAGFVAAGVESAGLNSPLCPIEKWRVDVSACNNEYPWFSHLIALERPGPGADGKSRTMRGEPVAHQTSYSSGARLPFLSPRREALAQYTIGIGDGGNEIGMGKIPHETIVKNIPNGDLIHCRVPTDHLIVAGVSNWGAYALAAGIYVLRGVKPPPDLFDPDREREILEVMVREGPLVDGVTGQQTATVDGLTWDEYAKPLVRIREILEQ